MEDFIKYLAGEWATISGAPVIFLAALLVMGVIIYKALRWVFDTKEQHATAQLKLRDDQIADYKNKLAGATPDEAKAKIEALEAAVSRLQPRSLSAEQAANITRTVAGPSHLISVALDAVVADSKFRDQLALAFRQGGWTTNQPMHIGPKSNPVCGLTLMVKNASALTPPEQLARAALQAAGLQFELFQDTALGLRTGIEVEILVTTKHD